MRQYRSVFGIIGLLLGLALSACGGGGGSSAAPTAPPQAAPPNPSPPVITGHPQEQRVSESQTASFSVQATSATTLSYQWLRGGQPIAGATQSSYALVATLPDDGAQFSVSVSNQDGAVTTNAAVLHVDAAAQLAIAPSVTRQPANASATAGGAVTFSVEASGTAPLTYQWERDGVPIADATDVSYRLPTTAIAENGARFVVRISNSAGSVSSEPAVLTVLPVPVAPGIAALDAPTVVNRGDVATFTVTANGTAPLSYQWRRNGVAIAAATTESFAIGPVSLDDHLAA